MERKILLVKKRVIIIGAGLGGLSAAIRLASHGFAVTVLEQQPSGGGKLQRIEEKGYRFDRGPSTITLPHMFEQVFAAAHKRMEDYVTFYRLEPSVRNVFRDGSVVDLHRSADVMTAQIAAYSREDAVAYPAFKREAARLYRISEERFLGKLLLDWRDKANPGMASAFLKIRPFTSLQRLLQRYFRHPNTLAMFGRYATYVGSSPFQAPAIFAMLAHVESELGVFGVKGGTSSIVEAFVRLAGELGVDLQYGVEAQRILVRDGSASGVESTAGQWDADIVIANGDVLTVCERLLQPEHRTSMTNQRIEQYEPSLSGFVMLRGIPRPQPGLLHHTVYFPERYPDEFTAIFRDRKAPRQPAIYICHPAASDSSAAPEGGSSLFILANAPYLSDRWSWDEQQERYGAWLEGELSMLGVRGLADAEVRQLYTPLDLYRDTGAHRGSIYGISSNSARQTFFRPANRSSDVRGLWFVGGTTHPGGGTPIVSRSGQLVAEQVIRLYG
ncbi:phytoene desaturase family protein [Paenibacillus sp. 1P07SE]|uniref:phytoene desaturase family protein n=1 Tax=Paenibacillus sp. 1P07SE TaxID=3132209 RepID=UPI0039A42655